MEITDLEHLSARLYALEKQNRRMKQAGAVIVIEKLARSVQPILPVASLI
jgi:hypothetical protein